MSETMETLETRGGVSQDAVKAQVYAALNWVKGRTGVYVTEQGSNSSGRWRRWSDGFLEQWVTKKVTSMVLDWSGFVTFPQAFTTTTYQAVAQPARADDDRINRMAVGSVFGLRTTGVYAGWCKIDGGADRLYIYAAGY